MDAKKKILVILVVALSLLALTARVSEAEPMGTAFTYQGYLKDACEPNGVADGDYDFKFELYDNCEDGSQVGDTVNKPDWGVNNGYFTVELDFPDDDPNVFNGDARWLKISIRPGELDDPNEYTPLDPCVELTPTPYGIFAKDANNANFAEDANNANFAENANNAAFADYAEDANNLDGYNAGNSPNEIAVSNGTKCNNLNADMLDGQHGSFYRDADNINAGDLNNLRFSAYGDLSTEGKLDYSHDGDLVTRSQANANFVNASGDTMSGSLTVNDNMTANQLNVDYLRLDGQILSSTGSDTWIYIDPNGNGHVDVASKLKISNIPTTGAIWPIGPDDNGVICKYIDISSARYKDDIKPLEDDFYKILQVNSKSFVYKTTGERGIGFIAEELDALGLNNLVIYEDGQPEGLRYKRVPVYLLEILKDQVKVTSELKEENELLKQRVETLEGRMQQQLLAEVKERQQ